MKKIKRAASLTGLARDDATMLCLRLSVTLKIQHLYRLFLLSFFFLLFFRFTKFQTTTIYFFDNINKMNKMQLIFNCEIELDCVLRILLFSIARRVSFINYLWQTVSVVFNKTLNSNNNFSDCISHTRVEQPPEFGSSQRPQSNNKTAAT